MFTSCKRLEAQLAEKPLVLARSVALLEHLLDLLARLGTLGRVLDHLRCDAQGLEVHLDGITEHNYFVRCIHCHGVQVDFYTTNM